ncbi:MAG: hypothetical protein AAF196_07645 [Planctomycetota bacterium]
MKTYCPTTGKRKHQSAKGARKCHRGLGNRLRVYRCPHCGSLHITNADKEEAHN